jgi:hypothetical protein
LLIANFFSWLEAAILHEAWNAMKRGCKGGPEKAPLFDLNTSLQAGFIAVFQKPLAWAELMVASKGGLTSAACCES